ncbi:putative reverse transcriptase domain-containing protein [Tanacetum coccineum]
MRFQWVSDAEPQSPEAAPQSPEQAPPSPDYVPGPEHPPSPDYVPGPEYPEYVAPSDDEIPVEDQPLLVDASPTALSPGYEEEESSEADDDVEEDEASEEDEDEEEEHLAPAVSTAATPPPPPRSPRTKVLFSQTCLRRARKTARHQPPMAASTESLIAEYVVAPTPPSPPPSLLSPCSSPLLHIQSPPLPILSPPLPLPSLPTHTSLTYAETPLGYRAAMIQSDIPETDMPFRKRLCLTALDSRVDYGFIVTMDASIRASKSKAMTVVEEVNERVTDLATTQRQDFIIIENESNFTPWLLLMSERLLLPDRHGPVQRIANDSFRVCSLIPCAMKMPPKRTTTPMIDDAIKQLIAQGVADALAEYEANRGSGNGDDSHDSRTGRRRQVPTTHECTYSDFLKCQPLNFKGTEGVIGLNQWLKKMEYVFHISNCIVANQVKFATCTLLGNALTWWNSHVKTISHEAAYGMTWKTLKKMMTDKYYPRGEIKKLEIELMFLKESDEVEKYVGGLPDNIQGSVMASKPKTMQDAIEITNELMDQKVRAYAERQAENKRKHDNNNQDKQQPPKKQSVAIA